MFNNTPHGFIMTFPNDWTISVQWGPGNYCDTKRGINPWDGKYHEFNSQTAEIAVYYKDTDKMYPLSAYDDVKGWVSASEVAMYIQWVALLDNDYHKVVSEAVNRGLYSHRHNNEDTLFNRCKTIDDGFTAYR